jgi:hypothetical protein
MERREKINEEKRKLKDEAERMRGNLKRTQ